MMWVVLVVADCVCKAVNGSVPVCVDRKIVALGILTRTPGLAGCTLRLMSEGLLKWPVAPLSRTKVEGEGNRGKSLVML